MRKNIKEELTKDDYAEIRSIIRRQIAILFFDLYKKRATWEK